MDISPRRHPSSLPTYPHSHGAHPYYDYHSRQRIRTSRPPSRACSASQRSHDEFSANNSTCEPSPVSPSTPHSVLSSPGLSHRYRDENASIMVPLTIAADRIHLDSTVEANRYNESGDESSTTPSLKYSETNPRQQPLRPW